MATIFIFFYLLIISVALSTFFKEKFDKTLATTIFTIIISLYFFGLIGQLKLGVLVCLLSLLMAMSYLVFRQVKGKKLSSTGLFTFGFFLFIAFYVFNWYLTRHRLLSSWDEFSHWGLVAKNMYHFNQFGSIPEATTYFKGYPPATALFQYFWNVVSGKFTEGNLFRSMNILHFSLILPFFSKFNFKTTKSGLLSFLLICIVSLTFFDNFFTTIYVDATLAIMFIYILYTYFSEDNLSLLNKLNLSAAFFIFPLIKAAGTGLAIIAILIILADIVVIKKKILNKTNLIFLVASVLSILIAKKTWSIYLTSVHANEAWNTSKLTISSVIGFYNNQGMPYQYQTYSNFIHAIFKEPLHPNIFNMTFFSWVAVSLFLSFSVLKLAESLPNYRRIKVSLISLYAGCFFYLVSLLFLYLYTYSEYEALKLASFGRYLSTYLLAIFIYLIFTFADIFFYRGMPNKLNQSLSILLVSSFLLGNVDGLTKLTLLSNAEKNTLIENRTQYATLENIDHIMKPTDRLYVIAQNTKGYEMLVAKYIITPYKANSDSSYSIGKKYGEEDVWTSDLTADEWRSELVKNYQYVYILKADQQFSTEFSSLFFDGNIDNNTFYKIIPNEYGPTLKKVP